MQVVNGATLMCTFGMAPSTLVVAPVNRTQSGMQVAANIMDHKPFANIQPFGMCVTPTNPQVAAATAAALGVLTPQPCIPNTQTPWFPGVPNLLIGHMPSIDNTCMCACLWGGVVSVVNPGQATKIIP